LQAPSLLEDLQHGNLFARRRAHSSDEAGVKLFGNWKLRPWRGSKNHQLGLVHPFDLAEETPSKKHLATVNLQPKPFRQVSFSYNLLHSGLPLSVCLIVFGALKRTYPHIAKGVPVLNGLVVGFLELLEVFGMAEYQLIGLALKLVDASYQMLELGVQPGDATHAIVEVRNGFGLVVDVLDERAAECGVARHLQCPQSAKYGFSVVCEGGEGVVERKSWRSKALWSYIV
jgi:hypothetical protein